MTKKEEVIERVKKQVNKILSSETYSLEFKEFIIFLKDRLIQDLNELEKLHTDSDHVMNHYIDLINKLENKYNQTETNSIRPAALGICEKCKQRYNRRFDNINLCDKCKDAKQYNKYKN